VVSDLLHAKVMVTKKGKNNLIYLKS
jgi:hypothetical protein